MAPKRRAGKQSVADIYNSKRDPRYAERKDITGMRPS